MNIDILIITVSVVGFILFIALHLIIFRNINSDQVFRWLFNIFFTVGIVIIGIEVLLLFHVEYLSTSTFAKLIIITLTLLLYTLWVFVYCFSLFATVGTAIRIQLLDLVTNAGSTGITKTEILKCINKKIILKHRLQRLVSSGDLDYSNNKYRLKNHWSLIFVPAIVVKIMWWIYEGKQ